MKRIVCAATTMALMALPLLNVWAASASDPTGKGWPLVFSENFEKGADRWTMTDPKAWDLKEDGDKKVLSLSGSSKYTPPVRSPHSIAWINDLDVKSFVLEVNVKQTGREYGHRDMCFFFGRQGTDQFYYVHVASVADPHAHSIFKVDKEPRISIVKDRTEGWKWDREYHTIRIVRDAEAGTIDVYADNMDAPIMHTVDKTFIGGAIGVGSFDDTGYFNEVTVWGK